MNPVKLALAICLLIFSTNESALAKGKKATTDKPRPVVAPVVKPAVVSHSVPCPPPGPIPIVQAPVAATPVPAASTPARRFAFNNCGVERDNIDTCNAGNEDNEYAQMIDVGR